MKRKNVLVLLLVLLILGIIGVIKIVGTNAETNKSNSKYEKPSVQDITGLGDSPYEISSKASAIAVEKQWYEYIAYNKQPVGESMVDSNTKLVFYDPYSYTNATIMDIKGADDEWSSANSITRSYTTSDSYTWGHSDTTTQTESITGTNADGILSIKDSGIHSREGKKWEDVSTTEGVSKSLSIGNKAVTLFPIEVQGAVQRNDSTVTTEVADRFSRNFGTSHTKNESWNNSESETISRTFNATYFNQYGSPLQWKVVMYEVFLPLKVDMQKKVDGKWYTVDSAYCLLKTMNGFSRAYIKDNKTYAEDWGTGEPVLWDEFENSFFTPEKLIEAYKNRLLPNE